MVIISTSAVEVSIQAVSPESIFGAAAAARRRSAAAAGQGTAARCLRHSQQRAAIGTMARRSAFSLECESGTCVRPVVRFLLMRVALD